MLTLVGEPFRPIAVSSMLSLSSSKVICPIEAFLAFNLFLIFGYLNSSSPYFVNVTRAGRTDWITCAPPSTSLRTFNPPSFNSAV